MHPALCLAVIAAATTSACNKSAKEGGASGTPAAPTGGTPVVVADAAAMVVDAAPSAPKTAVALPAPLAEFESVFVPLIKLPEGDARSEKTCQAIESLRVKSLAVERYRAPGIDESAWQTLGDSIYGTIEQHAIACGDGGADDPEFLASVSADYHKLLALLGAAPLETR
jgi:hypothetical protein